MSDGILAHEWDYDRLKGLAVYSADDHKVGTIDQILRLARIEGTVAFEEAMQIDSLDMTDAHRAQVLAACAASPEPRIVIAGQNDREVTLATDPADPNILWSVDGGAETPPQSSVSVAIGPNQTRTVRARLPGSPVPSEVAVYFYFDEPAQVPPADEEAQLGAYAATGDNGWTTPAASRLRADGRQPGGGRPLDRCRFEVIVLANNCVDDTAAVARAAAARYPGLALHVVDLALPEPHAHVGAARRLLMDEAARRLLQTPRGACGVIASTDADTRVAPDWLAATLAEVERGADAVGGRRPLGPARLAPARRGLSLVGQRDRMAHRPDPVRSVAAPLPALRPEHRR